jgi:hypothetical protein
MASRPSRSSRRQLAQHLQPGLAPQLALLLPSLIQGKVLQFVFHPAADHNQLVPVQHQLPQIALFPVRRPQAWKPSFRHQLQNVRRVPLVRLLPAHITGPDLRRIPDPDLVPQILHQFHEPLAVARGLHAHQPRPRQRGVKPLRLSRGVH